MNRPFSYRTSFWSVFPQGQDSIISDNFPKKTEFRLSLNRQTKDSNIIIQSTPLNSKTSYLFNKQVECWFRLFDQRIIGILSKADRVKLHYDHGITDINGAKMNFFGGFQCRRNLQDQIIKFGATYISDHFIFDNRVRAQLLNNGKVNFSVGHKGQFTFKDWQVQLMKMFDFTNKKLLRNSLKISYKMKEGSELFFSAENKEQRDIRRIDYSKFYSSFKGKYVKKIADDLKMGIQLSLKNKGKLKKRARLAIEKRNVEKETMTKLRFGTDKSLGFFFEKAMKNSGYYGLSLQYKRLEKQNSVKGGAFIKINF